jgi:hypothetical protein
MFPPPASGEIVTTGTITDAWLVATGKVRSSGYGALGLDGLTVRFFVKMSNSMLAAVA